MLDLNKLSKELTPSQKEQEKIHKIINEIIKKIQKVLPEATIIPGGSFAKGTWLRDNHDIDLFAQFTKEKNIVEKIEYALKKKFKKIERIHGSRDYFSFKEKNLNVEVIPVLKIKDPKEAKNITDISPLHVQFVNTHADEKTKAEIRIAKAFFKAQQLYGAETYIKGFSGYVIELLIIYYGSFFNLLREMQGWKEKTILSFEKEISLPERKQTPLTIIDPVQKERNAAAAISKEKKEQAKKIAEEFLNNPSKKFFTEKKVTWKEIKKHNVIIEVIPLKGNKDVVGTKILKVYERIRDELNQQEFKIKSSGWIWEKKAYLYYDVKGILSKQELREGPPTTHKENVRAFKKKHKHTCIQKGRIYARENREYTKAKYLVKALMKNPEIKKRVETIRIL